MPLTFDEYAAAAATTAIYRGTGTPAGLSYAALGLNDEGGEVMEKLLQLASAAEIRKEVGDTLWYVSAVCKEIQVPLQQVASRSVPKGITTFAAYEPASYSWAPREDLQLAVLRSLPANLLYIHTARIAGVVKKILRDLDPGDPIPQEKVDAISEDLSVCLWCLARICDTGEFSLADAAQGNLDKLRSRKERGVLKGSGDNR